MSREAWSSEWHFLSEEAETISLHDHLVSSVEEMGSDLILWFTGDGFDVTRDNSLNPTGRHRNTGPAAVYLENWSYHDGAFGRGCEEVLSDGTRIPLPQTPIPRELFLTGLEMEILDFDWDRENGVLTLFADGRTEEPFPASCGFCEVTLLCRRLLFCWNSLPEDAWFQEQPKK